MSVMDLIVYCWTNLEPGFVAVLHYQAWVKNHVTFFLIQKKFLKKKHRCIVVMREMYTHAWGFIIKHTCKKIKKLQQGCKFLISCYFIYTCF